MGALDSLSNRYKNDEMRKQVMNLLQQKMNKTDIPYGTPGFGGVPSGGAVGSQPTADEQNAFTAEKTRKNLYGDRWNRGMGHTRPGYAREALGAGAMKTALEQMTKQDATAGKAREGDLNRKSAEKIARMKQSGEDGIDNIAPSAIGRGPSIVPGYPVSSETGGINGDLKSSHVSTNPTLAGTGGIDRPVYPSAISGKAENPLSGGSATIKVSPESMDRQGPVTPSGTYSMQGDNPSVGPEGWNRKSPLVNPQNNQQELDRLGDERWKIAERRKMFEANTPGSEWNQKRAWNPKGTDYGVQNRDKFHQMMGEDAAFAQQEEAIRQQMKVQTARKTLGTNAVVGSNIPNYDPGSPAVAPPAVAPPAVAPPAVTPPIDSKRKKKRETVSERNIKRMKDIYAGNKGSIDATTNWLKRAWDEIKKQHSGSPGAW